MLRKCENDTKNLCCFCGCDILDNAALKAKIKREFVFDANEERENDSRNEA